MKYSFEDITRILLVLRNNKFNHIKTSREEKVCVQTLKRWRTKYGKGIWDAQDVKPPTPMETVTAEIVEEQKDVRAEMNELAITIMKVAKDKFNDDDFIKKMSPKDLALLIKEVVPFIIPKFDDGKGDVEKNYLTVFNNFTQNTYNQLKMSGDEQRKSSTKSSPKKLSSRNE